MDKKRKNPYLMESIEDEEHILDKILQYSNEQEKAADINRQIAAIKKGENLINMRQVQNPHGRILHGQDNQDMLDVFAGKRDFFETSYGKRVNAAPSGTEKTLLNVKIKLAEQEAKRAEREEFLASKKLELLEKESKMMNPQNALAAFQLKQLEKQGKAQEIANKANSDIQYYESMIKAQGLDKIMPELTNAFLQTFKKSAETKIKEL